MIDAIATKLAVKIKEANPEETASVEVMKFALFGIIHNTLTFATALIVGLCLGQLLETLLAAFSFMILRFVSGGYHFKTPLSCLLFSSFVFVLIPFIPMQGTSVIIINSISLILVLLFAPSNIREHIRVSEKFFPIFKVISALLVGAGFLLDNPIIILAFFVQSITLITFKKEVNNP
ncbi:accessory gene regulator ArgB-like protein [Cohnella cholangitidis]|uniref:accessory gene regulator ArgB-like protein n=1 Tax=Cohnella cholangitidis TaxID=2598458 RepID=UPI0015F94711|nr:accessory gene regulator B family protein [Cohnella cholangitidis]